MKQILYTLKNNLFLLLFVLPLQSLLGQTSDSGIVHFGNNEGLSNSSINTIFQDKLGVMWFGTWDGLNRYNGAEFKNYRPNQSEPSSISNHIIRSIFENEKGILWIATDYGINRFDVFTNKFQSFYFNYKGKSVFRENSFMITQNSKKQIIAATNNSGLFIYNSEKKDFTPLPLSTQQTNITKLFFDKSDCLWIVDDKQQIRQLTFQNLSPDSLEIKTNKLLSIPLGMNDFNYDGGEKIWMQAGDHTLWYYSIKDDICVPLLDQTKYGSLNAALETKDGYLLATTSGLIKYEKNLGAKSILFPTTSILSLKQGTQGVLWVGTDSQGIFEILPLRDYFSSFTKKQIPEFANKAVRSIYKDANDRLWFGTKGGGLVCVAYLNATKLQMVEKYGMNDGLSSNSILSIAKATHNNFWIGTDSKGLNYFSFAKKKIKNLKATPTFNPDMIRSVYAILQMNDSTLWIGTSGSGLFKLNLLYDKTKEEYDVKTFKHYVFKNQKENELNNNIIYSLVQQSDSVLWIATRGGGLNRLNLKNETFRAYTNSVDDHNSISSNDVICLCLNSNNQLLVGTSMGLNLLTEQKKGKIVFKRYTETDGLSNNSIHGILEDAMDNIWVSTSKGITRLNLDNNTFVHYYYIDGLQDDEFSDGAYLATPNKQELYFGGVNGFTIFHPEQIGLSSYTPPLFLDSFKIDNVEQPKSQNEKTDILIDNKSNFLSFHFSILDYVSNSKCKIAYKLIRDNNNKSNWVYLNDNKEIILTNIIPGNYQLQVKHSNSDNQWSKEIFQFQFHINPPWWQSTLAYWGYGIAILLLAYVIFRIQKHELSMRHKLELETLDMERKEEVHQGKLSFFLNIAHEFSNSITLIFGPCEKMLEKPDLTEKEKKYLSVIKQNAERMQHQIQQLMDFRKIETGHLVLLFEYVDIQEILKYTLDHFIDAIEEKRIKLTLNIQAQLPAWVTDRNSLEKIIFNLISNAVKYTPMDGWITVSLHLDTEQKLCFSCSNNGLGIKAEDIDSIFNRFKVLDNFESKLSQGIFTRNGIGLAMCKNLAKLIHAKISVDSKPNEYTTFTVILSEIKPSPSLMNEKEVKKEERIIFESPEMVGTLKKNILIIDDQPDIRQLIADVLDSRYAVREAGNGEEALAEIDKKYPDLIICDLIMPVMNGISFLKELRSRVPIKHIPVILLSSKMSVESQIEGFETGADMYLNKPFHSAHLLAMVNQTFNRECITRNYIESPHAHAEQYNNRLINKEDKIFVTQITLLLSKNLDNDEYNQDALAADLAISRVQLYRKIKKLTEKTPADFIRNYRLTEAEKLLKTTNKTVLEIMNDCGFHNKAYFYREFAKLYHCTPKEYHIKTNKPDMPK